MKIGRILFIAFVLAIGLGASDAKIKLPENGVIPDETTAVAVAEAVFRPVYGKNYVDKFVPYHAALNDGVWTYMGPYDQQEHALARRSCGSTRQTGRCWKSGTRCDRSNQ
jgi:hypothetical protein